MCVEVIVKNGESEIQCTTVGELARALKMQPLLVSPDPEENCLCNARFTELGAVETTPDHPEYPWVGYVIDVKGRPASGGREPAPAHPGTTSDAT